MWPCRLSVVVVKARVDEDNAQVHRGVTECCLNVE
jgi:hypothetical protein